MNRKIDDRTLINHQAFMRIFFPIRIKGLDSSHRYRAENSFTKGRTTYMMFPKREEVPQDIRKSMADSLKKIRRSIR
jgi:hypothetical protein